MKTLPTRPGSWQLLRIWCSIGLQSFGGGASTSYLIYRIFVEQRNWLLPEEYNLFWNLSVMAPGINLLGMAILIGRKLCGIRGILVSIAGLLVPSAAITCLLTMGFLSVAHFPTTQAMLRGVIPATAGVMLVVCIKYAQPLLKEIKAEGLLRLGMGLIVSIATLLAIILFQVAIPLVLPGAALLSVILFTRPVTRSTMTDAIPQVTVSKVAEEAHD
ncbi:MAG TPA: chromate transporter [Ktedonobacteraceae bacterium]|nr:chromate transporter [Ktedonobacteraceae bacterium]